ncbi:Alpha/Beta hydrolase protein [Apodospora peruviana]|uniref:Alpha/Beta hydrolase protein n=1 Tax=Apodospora peruviana TaxID=516989 RepID=A0AAE0IQM4_9PEZI|nr:Alpha/Beta hydrolase protein [Apodospora peruviana]
MSRGRRSSGGPDTGGSIAQTAVEFAQQAEKLSHHHLRDGGNDGLAVEALFVAPRDPVLVTSDGGRLPAVPLKEAQKLNLLKEELESGNVHETPLAQTDGRHNSPDTRSQDRESAKGNLRAAMPPSHTNPLFPPLPLYGPPSYLRNIQCYAFRVSSFFLSLAFLSVIVLGSLFTSIPPFLQWTWKKATFRDPDADRPFRNEELRRQQLRKEKERRRRRRLSIGSAPLGGQQQQGNDDADNDNFDGSPDPIVCDVGYYARRVGLDVEEYQVQTEDGFIIDLWHVYDPKEYTPLPEEERANRGPEVFTTEKRRKLKNGDDDHDGKKPKFPVLLMHGLLQSSGAYCVNDEDSLAFFLCKSGYDVWLGNNRCGFNPRHALLNYADPRMWCWNIRQMGVFDLPALTSRVLYETGFEKIGLISHSQGTTQTFVALAKEQRPELGERLTVFCALAPAAYAGPLIGKMYFKFMRVITPAMFRLLFGIHAFIPIMMTMHRLLPPRVYGWLGYEVFSFLFNWTDVRWDRALRDRMFQFAPVYVSAESMRWWLGRECFAKQKCILATKEEWRAEEREDNEKQQQEKAQDMSSSSSDVERSQREAEAIKRSSTTTSKRGKHAKGSTAWYNSQAPPFALWVCGNDCLVDGDKLLCRFERGREPHVDVVHAETLEGYEHLDIIWAMDAVDRVFKGVREVLWKTCDVREACRVPVGCEGVEAWVRPAERKDDEEDDEMESSSSEDLST